MRHYHDTRLEQLGASFLPQTLNCVPNEGGVVSGFSGGGKSDVPAQSVVVLCKVEVERGALYVTSLEFKCTQSNSKEMALN